MQSKRSSSSRFSAASLRGLIGHHTAPARLIPNTQVNATGSLAERIATLSPGATPTRTSAAAMRKLSSRTSAYDELRPSRGQAGSPGIDRGPLVEVVDQSHDAQAWTVRTGSDTSPNERSTPSSSRCPKAWQPEAKPTRLGGCISSEYAA